MSAKRTVLVTGNFNILHPGHLRLLRFARECGDRLVVGVHSDRLAGDAAHIPEAMRLEGVRSNSFVDEAFILDTPVPDLIRRMRPDIVVKGKEHQGQLNPEEAVLAEYGGTLIFSSGEVVFSSIELLNREFREALHPEFLAPTDYCQRHGIEPGWMARMLAKFRELRVVVIGDLIVDEYIACAPLGMSHEDPTIVVTPLDTARFVGGAGIVAAHAAGMGARVRFITVGGADAARDFALKALQGYGVQTEFLVDTGRPTTLKQRFRSKGKTLLRVSHLRQASIGRDLREQLNAAAARVVKDCNLLVFSDFNYGCLPADVVDSVTGAAKASGAMAVADSQSSSQVGDVSRFRGMDLLTPTEREARLALRDQDSGLVVLAESLRRESAAKNVLLKLGEEGVLIHADTPGQHSYETDRISALNKAPRDVAGAGDSMLIAASMAMASGSSIWEASLLGSLAAAIQVSRIGNTPLTLEDFRENPAR